MATNPLATPAPAPEQEEEEQAAPVSTFQRRQETIARIEKKQKALNLGAGKIQSPNQQVGLGESSFLEEEVIPLVGEVVAPLLAEKGAAKLLTKAIPNPLVRTVAEIGVSGLASFGGRFAGEELNEEVQDFTGSKFAPALNEFGSLDTIEESTISGLFDVAMNSMFKGGVLGLRALGVKPDDALARWNALLKRENVEGGMTLGQIADESVKGNLLRGLEEILRGGAGTKAAFRASDARTIEAVAGIVAERSNSLTQEALGKLILDNLKGGTELQSHLAGQMFEFLDDLPVTVPTTQPVKGTGAFTPFGQSKASVNTVTRAEAPVDLESARISANFIGDKLARQGGFTDIEGRLSSLSKGDTKLTFKDSHELLSRLKRAQRDGVFESAGIANVELGGLISQIQNSFDTAGNKILNGADQSAADLYRQARNFTREGAEIFGTDFLQSIAKQDPSRVGSALVGGVSPAEVRQLRKMVNTADEKALEAGGSSFGSTWGDIQKGYVGQLFPTQFAEDSLMFGDALGGAPAFRLLGGSPSDRQFQEAANEILGEEGLFKMQQGLLVLRDTILESSSVGALASRETGVAVGSGGGDITELSKRLIGVLLAPAGAAKLFTNPELIDTLIRWKSLKIGSTAAKRAGLKLLTALEDVAQDDKIREAVGLDPTPEEAPQ